MKHLITFIILILILTSAYSQDSSLAQASPIVEVMKKKTNRGLQNHHKAIAKKELLKFVKQHVSYPSVLLNNQVESKLKLRFDISPTGKIESINLIDNEYSNIYKPIVDSLNLINKIQIPVKEYLGPNEIEILLEFKM